MKGSLKQIQKHLCKHVHGVPLLGISQEIGHWGVNFESLGNNAHQFTNYFESKMCKYCLSLLRHQNGWWLKNRAKMDRISESRFSDPGHTGTPAASPICFAYLAILYCLPGPKKWFPASPNRFYHLIKNWWQLKKAKSSPFIKEQNSLIFYSIF